MIHVAEVDAALDEHNTGRIGTMLSELSRSAQATLTLTLTPNPNT